MAKAEKAAKQFATFENITMSQNEAVKKGMEQFMSAAGDFSALSRDGVAAATESAKASAKGMQSINARAMSFFQNQMAASMEAGKAIASAKTMQEAVELQAAYSKTALESYIQETSAMFGLMAGAMREAVEPLNAHAGSMVEKIQSAA